MQSGDSVATRQAHPRVSPGLRVAVVARVQPGVRGTRSKRLLPGLRFDMPVRELYEQTLAERGYQADPAQLRAIDALERCENEWLDYKARRSSPLSPLNSFLGRHPPIPRGVYMHGGVGR